MGKIRRGIYGSYYEHVGFCELLWTGESEFQFQTGRRRAAGILCGRHTDRRTAAGGNTGNRSNSGEPADRTAGRSGIYVYRQRECHGYQSVQGR